MTFKRVQTLYKIHYFYTNLQEQSCKKLHKTSMKVNTDNLVQFLNYDILRVLSEPVESFNY